MPVHPSDSSQEITHQLPLAGVPACAPKVFPKRQLATQFLPNLGTRLKRPKPDYESDLESLRTIAWESDNEQLHN